MRYQNDAWLSERLHKNVFSLQVSPEDSQSQLPSQEIVSPAFIYSKVPMQSTEIFSLLINNNFKIKRDHLVDLVVCIEKCCKCLYFIKL